MTFHFFSQPPHSGVGGRRFKSSHPDQFSIFFLPDPLTFYLSCIMMVTLFTF